MNRPIPSPHKPLSTWRIVAAVLIAVATDGLQIALGPLGWTFIDEVLDVMTAGLEVLLLGFHPLLLPTVIIEFVPVVDMLPLWTGCVLIVIARKRRKAGEAYPQNPPQPPVIDV